MLGYGEDELPGHVSSWSDLIHPGDKQATLAANQQSIDGNADSFEVEFRMRAKSGDWRWILGRGKVVGRDESGKAARMVGTHTDITDRKHFEERLRAALKERESMLLEVHHRVKNNLQVILSLLDLSGYRAKKPETLDFIKEVQGKINSMALIHSELFMEEALSEIDIASYMRLLATKVRALYEKQGVTLDINEDAVTLGIDKALPVGLVLNELITNAFKYAFPDGSGALRCRVDRQGESMRIEVADDGPGLPDRVDPLHTKTLGFKLVREIADMQLHGRMTIDGQQGTTVSITFPVE
jgi:PAS domain S-box-containing protein